MNTRRSFAVALSLLAGLAAAVPSAQAQLALGYQDESIPSAVHEVPLLTQKELDDLLGPIALYPDPLIAQILPASTYPLEVVQASRWVQEQPDLAGVDDQPWDASVLAIAHYPSVIAMMNEKLDWTIRLGQAFMAQPQDVMDSIQRLRNVAASAGALASTAEQQVIVEGGVVQIVPAQPDVIYVPVYEPSVVYVRPSWGYYTTSCVSFGPAFAFGWWLDLGCDWHHRHVYYHHWRDHHHDEWRWHRVDRHRDWRDGDRSWRGRDGDRRSGRDWRNDRGDREWRGGEEWKRDANRERPAGLKPGARVPGSPALGVEKDRDGRTWVRRPRTDAPGSDGPGWGGGVPDGQRDGKLPDAPRSPDAFKPGDGAPGKGRGDRGVQPQKPMPQLPQGQPQAQPEQPKVIRPGKDMAQRPSERTNKLSREGDGAQGLIRRSKPQTPSVDIAENMRRQRQAPEAPRQVSPPSPQVKQSSPPARVSAPEAPRQAPRSMPQASAPQRSAAPSAPRASAPQRSAAPAPQGPRPSAAPSAPSKSAPSAPSRGNQGGGMQRGMGNKSRD